MIKESQDYTIFEGGSIIGDIQQGNLGPCQQFHTNYIDLLINNLRILQ